MSDFQQYLYLVVLSLIFGFAMAFWIGANDVANAFGSSVSAGSLSLLQAVILGGLMEFLGAILLGASVAGTVRGKVIDPDFYTEEPEIYMLGCTTALMAASIWLMTATMYGFPVSTTHDILAALIGFSIAANGFESVVWNEAGKIFISWFAAPLFSGVISSLFFLTLNKVVLQSDHMFERALNVFPVVVFCAITIDLFFVLFKSDNNVKKLDDWQWGHYVVLPCALGGGFLAALCTFLFLVPYLRKKVESDHAEQSSTHDTVKEIEESINVKKDDSPATSEGECCDQEGQAVENAQTNKDVGEKKLEKEDPDVATVEQAPKTGVLNWVADNTYRQDLKAQSFHENKRTQEIWDGAKIYDPKVEMLFSYLQVFTACLASFAHGANDVANAIAPISAVIDIYNTGEFNSKAPVQKWLLVMGGGGIALGCYMYGYKIIKSVGFKLTAITPARGFCIELAAAFCVSLASFMSIPVSTTQCLVGATAGVGLASGGPSQVDGWYLLRTCVGWVGIFFIACIFNAGFFSFVAYSPSLA